VLPHEIITKEFAIAHIINKVSLGDAVLEKPSPFLSHCSVQNLLCVKYFILDTKEYLTRKFLAAVLSLSGDGLDPSAYGKEVMPEHITAKATMNVTK
jgi:hypothetical protein